MIKYNDKYSINNGQGTIVFTEGNKGTVNADYEIQGNKGKGKINGTLENNILSGTYHVDSTAGLIEFAFTENGFDAKWKQGIEPGPMRGKWSGTIESEVERNEVIVKRRVYLYEFCQGYDENRLLELESILTELVVEGTFQGKESAYTLIETIEQINRTFGQLCWFSDREPFDGINSLEYYSMKWGELLEALKEKAVLSIEFRTLGDNIHSDYHAFFDGNKAKEFTEETYTLGIEKADSYEAITWFTAATINGEYFENNDLVLAAGEKAIQLVENPDDYVGVCFNDDAYLTYNEEIMRKAVDLIRDLTDEIDPEFLGFLREALANNGYDDLLEDL
jgi:hypothetical protein